MAKRAEFRAEIERIGKCAPDRIGEAIGQRQEQDEDSAPFETRDQFHERVENRPEQIAQYRI